MPPENGTLFENEMSIILINQKMKVIILQSLFIAVILGFTSCKPTKNISLKQFELFEKQWILAELNGKAVSESAREPFVVFEKAENRINGNTSCNNFFGKFELIKGDKIKFSQVGMTRMACIGNNIENQFIQTIEQTASYKTDSNSLFFLNETGKTLARFYGVTKN